MRGGELTIIYSYLLVESIAIFIGRSTSQLLAFLFQAMKLL